MTIRPVPASRPWFIMRARFVRMPGFSLAYQLRISFTRVPMASCPFDCRRRAAGGCLRALRADCALCPPPVEVVGRRDVVGAAEDDGLALVILGGHLVEDAAGARA